jgi:hypothetical protein
MKQLNFMMMLILIAIVYSCDCDKTNNCGALSEEGLASLIFDVNDTVRFENAIGNKIEFVTQSRTSTPAYSQEACKKNGFGGCDCSSHCSANGSTMAQSTTSLNSNNLYIIRIDEETEGKTWSSRNLFFYILDYGSSHINLTDPTHIDTGDSLLTSIQLGNHVYNNVYTFTRDTVQYPNVSVWKAYFTTTDGVVGFRERDTHTLYCKK